MDKKKPSKDERGNVRYLWVLVGAYLLYLAWQQLQLLLRGEAVNTGDMVLCVVSGAVFAAVGAWVIYREWRAWQYAQAHKDDPETWGDASEKNPAYPDAPELEEGESMEPSDAQEREEDEGEKGPDAPESAEPDSDEAEGAGESADGVGEPEPDAAETDGEESEVEENDGEEDSAKE